MLPSYETIIGIDCSLTDTGVVRLDRTNSERRWEPCISLSTAEFKNDPDPERQCKIVRAVMQVVYSAKADRRRFAVAIEDYAFSTKGGKAFTRAEVAGVIKYFCLTYYGIDVFQIAPSALKRFMGVAKPKGVKKFDSKEAMRVAASLRFQFDTSNHNIADAFCLARYLAANREGHRLAIIHHKPLSHLRCVQGPARTMLTAKSPKILLANRLTKKTATTNL